MQPCNSPSRPPAEGQCAEVLVDCCQQCLGTWQPQRHMAHVKVLHVVGALQVLTHVALASAAAHKGNIHVRVCACRRAGREKGREVRERGGGGRGRQGGGGGKGRDSGGVLMRVDVCVCVCECVVCALRGRERQSE